jgi:hypothetical protein
MWSWGVRGYVKRWEPTCSTHTSNNLGKKKENMVENNLTKLNWRMVTIFDVLFTGMNSRQGRTLMNTTKGQTWIRQSLDAPIMK